MFTFCGVQSLCSSTVFRIVVDEHVVGHSQEISLHTWGEWYDHLEKLNESAANDYWNNNKQIIIFGTKTLKRKVDLAVFFHKRKNKQIVLLGWLATSLNFRFCAQQKRGKASKFAM